ncbi:flagellar hook protein FlgE [Rhizobium mongolense]|uniref:Flagellar hook protein FlgE n=1 Tax=Rhizobium gallicum TaxID=56730 RepID=A0A1L5NEZ4_9HYPH|nr:MULTISPECIES: flagellar hook protein FlgE [Rhizobium]APO66428.1 flagellar hook protein FlgE [Rhizobium gallicum]QPB20289.1 flagellar hook protein FlgE [Rhizobium sp. 007]ULJ70947.1 flagellar hook protein FlgE [Rhizobium gallicum]WFU87870.1 flagellar hook protein FlgE [Rhizobium sp. CC1099]
MSIFGSMKTAVSGMNAQANRLSTVADNIANANTTGYKAVSTAFSSLVLPSTAGNYNSGGVQTSIRQAVSDQGDISYTTSGYDLAISGDGFFIVQGADGTPVLTRAGDFTKDDEGNLVNSAGFTLMGYPYGSSAPAVVVNGFDGLVPINVLGDQKLEAVPTANGTWTGNLKPSSPIETTAADLPSANNATATSDTQKYSIVTYDKLGSKVMYDIYFTKVPVTTVAPLPPTGTAYEWEMAVFRNADKAATGTSSFPYSSAAVDVKRVYFDSSGQMLTDATHTSTTDIIDPVTGLTINMSLDLSQVGDSWSGTGNVDGQGANSPVDITIDADGVVYSKYDDGSTKPVFQIPLANVPSPDLLTLMSGNVYSANGRSGVTVTGFPQTSGFGKIQSGALEGSNVDMAGELTEMIESQRSYTANSKVFQTGSDLMDVLVNLKR